MDGQLFTWDALVTMSGASLFTFLFVQYTKKLIDRWIKGLPTDVYAVTIAFVALTLAQLATGANAADWRLYPLALANAFLVAAAAGQMQNKAINPPGASSTTSKGDKTDGT